MMKKYLQILLVLVLLASVLALPVTAAGELPKLPSSSSGNQKMYVYDKDGKVSQTILIPQEEKEEEPQKTLLARQLSEKEIASTKGKAKKFTIRHNANLSVATQVLDEEIVDCVEVTVHVAKARVSSGDVKGEWGFWVRENGEEWKLMDTFKYKNKELDVTFIFEEPVSFDRYAVGYYEAKSAFSYNTEYKITDAWVVTDEEVAEPVKQGNTGQANNKTTITYANATPTPAPANKLKPITEDGYYYGYATSWNSKTMEVLAVFENDGNLTQGYNEVYADYKDKITIPSDRVWLTFVWDAPWGAMYFESMDNLLNYKIAELDNIPVRELVNEESLSVEFEVVDGKVETLSVVCYVEQFIEQ